MPNQDFSKSVFQADANAATEWGRIGAGIAVDFRADLALQRGIDIDLGLMAIANLDAAFSQYLAADLQGTAQAQASVRAQIQLPMNLFKEVGLAIRLQAIAELAAGVRLGVGLALGDLLALASASNGDDDVAVRLLRVFLDEVELELGFYAKAAVTAQAYANLVITGSAIEDLAAGTKPGFTIAAGYGAGLKVGGGYEVFGTAGIDNFARLVARSTDIIVDEAVQRLAHALPDSASDVRAVLFGARPALKIALRLSFELGEQFASTTLSRDAAGAEALSIRAVQVILEELQRAVCEGAVRASLAAIEALLAPVNGSRQAWDACHDERHALADLLEGAAAPLTSPEAIAHWLDVMASAAALQGNIGGAQPTLIEPIAMGWAALKLAARVGERVARASASVSVIGVPPHQVESAFVGPITGAVPAAIRNHIRAQLAVNGANVAGPLEHEHLATYLADAAIADVIDQANPGLAAFLDDIRGGLAPDVPTLIRLLLENASGFAVAGRAVDPTALLTEITNGVQHFVSTRMSAAFRAQLEPAFVGNNDLRIYVDEVLLPALDFALAVALQEAIGWATSGRSATAVTEALSAVLLKLLGRSLVAVADTTSAHIQEQMHDLLSRAASRATRRNGLVTVLTRDPALDLAASDVAELVTDALEVAADVFGPVPSEQRARIRGHLYDLLDPMAGRPAVTLLDQLEDAGFVPNEAALRGLAEELGQLATERFVLFVEGLVLRMLQRMADAWLAALSAAIAVAEQFLAELSSAIALIGERLQEIAHEIEMLGARIARALTDALGDVDRLLDSFSSARGRARFVDKLASSVSSTALGVLEDNWAYTHVVPGNIRRDVRARVRAVVRDLLDGAPLDEFLATIGAVRDEVVEIVEDAQSLDRDAPLAPQIADLVLARIARVVADGYGNIRIKVAFGFHWDTPLGRVDEDFDLGRIKIHVGDVADVVRPIAAGLGAFEEAIGSLADHIKVMLDADDATSERRAEYEGVSAEHQRLADIAAERRNGPKSVFIERPVQMQATQGATLVVMQLSGFSAAILTVDEHTPQRLFVLLNGEPVALNSFRVEAAAAQPALEIAGPRIAAPGIAAPGRIEGGLRNSAILASARQQRRRADRLTTAGAPGVPPRQASRATLGSKVQIGRDLHPAEDALSPPRGVKLSARLPAELLVEGLNTLIVTAVTGPGEQVTDRVGFLYAATGKQPPGSHRPPPRGLDGIPSSVPLTPGAMLLLPSDRKRAAQRLARRTKPPSVSPLARAAAHSSAIAQRAGLAPVAPSAPLGRLRLSPGGRPRP